MSVLSDALAAMDKATPGPWIYCGCGSCQLVWGDGFLIHDQPDGGCEAPIPYNSTGINNAIIIGAAPDALAWIKEALPWLEIRADELRYEIDAQETLIGPVLSDDCIGTMKSDLARLDALIAQAKPEV